jgi:hypothetical protein
MADPRRFPQDFDEVGGALADADYILATDVSDTTQSASGTVKKTLLSRIATWLFAKSEIGGALADADTIVVTDATDSTVKTSLLSRLWTYIQSKSAALSEGGVALADADTIPFIDATDSTEKRTLMSRLTTYITTSLPITIGTWSPTVTNVAGYSGAITVDNARYIRVSSIVIFAIRATDTLTGVGPDRSFRVTLPVARTAGNFAAAGEAIGSGGSNIAGAAGFNQAITGGQTLECVLRTATSSGSITGFWFGLYTMS